MKQLLAWLKRYLRWLILGVTLWFILTTFLHHWQDVTSVQVSAKGWLLMMGALATTMLAHVWAAWVWGWILQILQQSISMGQAIPIYLLTNLAKYWPGNVGHFYLRITTIAKVGGSWAEAGLSTLLEPLLVVMMALMVVLVCSGFGWIAPMGVVQGWRLPLLGLIGIVVGIHPRVLNPLLQWLNRKKFRQQTSAITPHHSTPSSPERAIAPSITHYPLRPLLGQLGFLLLRGAGFILTWQALSSLQLTQIPALFSAFSLAWLLGMVIPGAPGGIGVFEATAIALLDAEQFPVNITLSTVAIFRVISILAEVLTAGIAWRIRPEKTL